jgi:hypothetical protein
MRPLLQPRLPQTVHWPVAAPTTYSNSLHKGYRRRINREGCRVVSPRPKLHSPFPRPRQHPMFKRWINPVARRTRRRWMLQTPPRTHNSSLPFNRRATHPQCRRLRLSPMSS